MTKNHTSNGEEERRPDERRRQFCRIALGGMSVAAVGTVGYPVVSFLQLPKSLRPQEILELNLADLKEGAPYWDDHKGRQIVVLRVGDEVRAFDGACPHLGCVVLWEGASQSFKCPCHGASFDPQGLPTGGPVNAPLQRVEFTVEAGVLRIV